MNDQTEIETGTAIALPMPTDLAQLFKAENGIAGIISQLETAAREEAKALDASTKRGREALISLAAKVSKSKAELDRQGKALTEAQRREVNAVNAGRKIAEDRLAALRDEIRKPVTDWEAAENARVERIKATMQNFDLRRADPGSEVHHIRQVIAEIEAMPTGADVWAEFVEIATARRESALTHFRGMLAAAEKRDADAAELARLRAEAEERARKDAEEASAKADAERQAKLEAEMEAVRVRRAQEAELEKQRQAERLAQIERDKATAAARAAEVEKERAAHLARVAEERHAKEMAESKAREEAAAQRERDRIDAERKAADDARAKREKDKAHRARIRDDIATSMNGFTDELTAGLIADAIMDGAIAHVQVAL